MILKMAKMVKVVLLNHKSLVGCTSTKSRHVQFFGKGLSFHTRSSGVGCSFQTGRKSSCCYRSGCSFQTGRKSSCCYRSGLCNFLRCGFCIHFFYIWYPAHCLGVVSCRRCQFVFVIFEANTAVLSLERWMPSLSNSLSMGFPCSARLLLSQIYIFSDFPNFV